VTIVSPTKTAEPIDISFGMWTRFGPEKHVLDGGTHWHNQANTIEPSVCGGDAALYQITLTTSSHRRSQDECGGRACVLTGM